MSAAIGHLFNAAIAGIYLFVQTTWLVGTIGLSSQAFAQNPPQCAADLDNDGVYLTEGEVERCDGLLPGASCPIEREICTRNTLTPLCPDGISLCDSLNNTCTASYGPCQPVFSATVTNIPAGELYVCPDDPANPYYVRSLDDCNANCTADCQTHPTALDAVTDAGFEQCGDSGFIYETAAACGAGCSAPLVRQCSPAYEDVCPFDAARPCVDVAGDAVCTPHDCLDPDTAIVDLAEPPPIENYTDDGALDANGNCTQLQLIFNGEAMECHPAGVSNAFKNCCSHDGEVYVDSMGANFEQVLTYEAIAIVAGAAAAGAGAFASSIASGQSAAQAGQAAQTAISNNLAAAMNPATIAFAIAIALIMAYVLQGCPPEELTTAALVKSEMCVLLGEYCVKEWFGGCVQEERRYCCFHSVLARVLHEQGRPQLSTFPNGFGTVDAPNCRGFDPIEFQAIDFSKIDFTEYYGHLRTATQSEMDERVTQGIEDYQNALQ